MNADQILVVNDGEIVESGNHLDLLKCKGYYYRLCSWQGVAVGSPGGAETPAIYNDITSTQEEVSGMDSRMRAETANSTDVLGFSEYQTAMDPPDPTIQTTLPASPEQNDICEHCRRCFDEAASALEIPQNARRPVRVLKPEAPVFVPRAFDAHNSRQSQTYYLQIGTALSASTEHCANDHPPSGYASDTGESVEIRTVPERKSISNPITMTNSVGQENEPPPHLNGLENDMNGNGQRYQGGPATSRQGYNTQGIDDILSTVELNVKKNAIRRNMSKSEPVGLGNGVDDNDVLGVESDESQSSNHNAPTRQTPITQTNENSPKRKRRRRRNNWRRRRELRTNTSTQSGNEGI